MKKNIVVLAAIMLLLGSLSSGCIYITNPPAETPSSAAPAPVVYQQPNQTPVAEAGSAMECWAGQSVTLQGSAYDPDGDPISYQWNCAGGSLSGYTVLNPTFYAPTTLGDCICTLTVTDSHGATSQDSVIVRVIQQYQQYNDGYGGCCGTCTTTITLSAPPAVCAGNSIWVSGCVGFRCDSTTRSGYVDPEVRFTLDGRWPLGSVWTRDDGNYGTYLVIPNGMFPSRHRLTATSKFGCCREGTVTVFIDISDCNQPCVPPCQPIYYDCPCCPTCQYNECPCHKGQEPPQRDDGPCDGPGCHQGRWPGEAPGQTGNGSNPGSSPTQQGEPAPQPD